MSPELGQRITIAGLPFDRSRSPLILRYSSLVTTPPLPLEARLLNKYGEKLSDEHLNAEQQQEFLLALWNIMTAFVELGFKVGSIDDVEIATSEQNLPQLNVDVLSLLNVEDTEHETVAPHLNTDE